MEALFILTLIAIAFFTGSRAEARHYRRIREREERTKKTPVVTFKSPPADRPIARSELATGSVVISVDYFKRFVSSFRMIFGGELGSYASLLDRGRREAVLRMRETKPDADLFLNCRIETSTISRGQGDSVGSVEIVAYSTAIFYQ